MIPFHQRCSSPINLIITHIDKATTPYKWANSPNNLTTSILAYADDIAFYAPDDKSLIEKMKIFENFLNFYGFEIDHDKSAHQFLNYKNNAPEQIFIQGKNIPQLDESKAYRYLGYLIAPNLKWKELRDAAIKSCRNKLTFLKHSRLPALLKAQIINKAFGPKSHSFAWPTSPTLNFIPS